MTGNIEGLEETISDLDAEGVLQILMRLADSAADNKAEAVLTDAFTNRSYHVSVVAAETVAETNKKPETH